MRFSFAYISFVLYKSKISRINAVMGHVQTMYQWNSLDANMCLDIISIKKYNGAITTNDLT
jgi:hypothetical protein